ncbi:MAG: hypothetical protein WAM71_07035, partial [Candidatus Korobacteraceae bacterium]
LALSIKASEGVSEGVGAESAGGDAAEGDAAGGDAAGGGAAGGASGHGGRSGCVPRFKTGGALEQGGVLCACDCSTGGGVGPPSLAKADKSAPDDELPPGTGMAMENVPINL